MTIEYLVIGFYLVLLIAIGAVVKRFNKDDSDYFRNGCKGTWWLVGASAFMVQFSAWTFTGAAGAAYNAGWSVMVIFIANAAGYTVGAIGVSGWFRQLRVVTVPEAIRARFGPGTQQFYAWMSVVTGLLYASLWLYGLSLFCSAVFDFEQAAQGVASLLGPGIDTAKYPVELILVAVVIGMVVLVYSTVGGSWAVMATDFLQTLILIPITLLVAYLSLKTVGGVSGLFEGIRAAGLNDEFALINEPGVHQGSNDFTYVWAAAFFLKQITTMNTLTSSQRFFAVKTGKDARKAAALAGVLMLLGSLVWFIPPIVGRLMFTTEIDGMAVPKPAETSYAVVSMNLLPAGMTGLMVVAMLSATMSSMDSGLNRNAAIFVRDILPALYRLLGIEFDREKPRLWIAQIASFAFGLIIVGLAVWFILNGKDGGVFKLMLNVGAMLALPLAIPMLWALLIRKAPPWSAVSSIAVGFLASALAFYSERLFGEEWPFKWVVFANVAAGSLGFLITLPFWSTTSKTYRAKVDTFFANMHRPIDFATEVGEGNDLSQLKIMGSFAVTIGLFICGLMFLPNNDWGDRLAILFVGGFVAVFGIVLIGVSHRANAPLPVDSSGP